MLASWPEMAGVGAGRGVGLSVPGPFGAVIRGDGTPGPGRDGLMTGSGKGSGPAPKPGPSESELVAVSFLCDDRLFM